MYLISGGHYVRAASAFSWLFSSWKLYEKRSTQNKPGHISKHENNCHPFPLEGTCRPKKCNVTRGVKSCSCQTASLRILVKTEFFGETPGERCLPTLLLNTIRQVKDQISSILEHQPVSDLKLPSFFGQLLRWLMVESSTHDRMTIFVTNQSLHQIVMFTCLKIIETT